MLLTLPIQCQLGIPTLDLQHQEILTKIEAVRHCVFTDCAYDAVGINSVLASLKIHFADEETLMQRVAFPDMIDHIKDHIFIQALALELLKPLSKWELSAILTTLKEKLLTHTTDLDMQLANYIHNLESFKRVRFKSRSMKSSH